MRSIGRLNRSITAFYRTTPPPGVETFHPSQQFRGGMGFLPDAGVVFVGFRQCGVIVNRAEDFVEADAVAQG